jgi:hypothetical protein
VYLQRRGIGTHASRPEMIARAAARDLVVREPLLPEQVVPQFDFSGRGSGW